jgi:hypothetical protein
MPASSSSANGAVLVDSTDAASYGEVASSETNELRNVLNPYTANRNFRDTAAGLF